jgi:hypothetical protein
MCDPTTILELNTLGITKFRDGKRQEAMDHFRASMANLLTYISAQQEELVTVNIEGVDAEVRETAYAKRVRETETTEELPPLKKRRQKGPVPPAVSTQSRSHAHAIVSTDADSGNQPSSPQSPRLTHPKQSQDSPLPYALLIPFETPTADTFPEHAATLFNQCVIFPPTSPQEGGPLPREQCDVVYASLLYNMGLVLHNYGLQYSCGRSLHKALETYEVAHGVLLHDLQRPSSATSTCDVHHWLLYALFNNMANIYAFAHSPVMTQYCLERLRWVLAHSDSALLQSQDLLFLVVNLDVLGTAGPGVISAASA